MSNSDLSPEEWLGREDIVAREGRLSRLKWLESKTPRVGYWLFRGGMMSKHLFEEARYCFVYGQFLAAIVLGLAFIEHTLAGLFYMAGRNDLERASISKLLREALNYNWITPMEYEHIERARQIRNSVTHFRKPLDDDTIEKRLVLENELPYTIIEEDAQNVMEIVLHLLGTSLLSVPDDETE